MIKFFRRIRQNLLLQGKTGKYLTYAIGEIFLVMVGILLALQVNNWNNRRIEKLKEQAILKNMRVDFKNNIDNLDLAYYSFKEAYQASVVLLEIIKDDKPINPSEVEQLIDAIVNKPMSIDLITGSINEILNTGSLHLISDPALRKQISNWSHYFSDTEDDIVIYRAYLFDLYIPSLTEKVRLRNMSVPSYFEDDLELQQISRSNFKVDYDKTIRTFEFENETFNTSLNYMYVLNSYKVFKNYLTDTLNLIEANIKE
ncbi:hypothetical protein OE09_1010 [Flavobacteriaceae bacterium MAR_2010_72]|nr:hypothetical protein OE09_1010 [Flavobacteriaceae bacterium MAR_2010_72]